MRYFSKSAEGKAAWESYLKNGGYADAQVFADAPVLSPPKTEQFFYTFGTFASYAARYGIYHNFPEFKELEIVESIPRNSPISYACLDDSILRGLFTQGGVLCEGLFAAGVADTMTSYMYNVDAGYYTVYVITGISAPSDEFYQLEEILAQALASFKFHDNCTVIQILSLFRIRVTICTSRLYQAIYTNDRFRMLKLCRFDLNAYVKIFVK